VSSVLADTHTIIWALFEPTRLSEAAKAALRQAEAAESAAVCVSAISLVEVRYLVEKGTLSMDKWSDFLVAIRDSSLSLVVLPLEQLVACTIERIPRDSVPDMPDRIIAATALAHGLPLVTRDSKLRALQLPTIW
jgi:PIN domain nuclease of toxin-antitoxin system